MEQLLLNWSELIGNNIWLGLGIAFLAGVITSFTPCSLTCVPLVVGMVSGYNKDRRTSFIYTLLFCAGMTFVFVVFGIVIFLLGEVFLDMEFVWNLVLAVFTTLMAMQLFNIINIFPPKHFSKSTKLKGGVGAFLLGAFGAFMDSPCTTPALLAIIALIASGQNILFGCVMMLLFSLGHSILFVISGTFQAVAKSFEDSKKFARLGHIMEMVMGVLMIALSMLLFYNAFSSI